MYLSLEVPTDWALTTVSGASAYYIRARVTVAGTGTAIASMVTVGLNIGVCNSASSTAAATEALASAMGLEDLPVIQTDVETKDLDLLRDSIEATLIGIKSRYDGFHLIYTDPSDATTVYTYNNSINHWIWEYTFENEYIIPNLITAVNYIQEVGLTQFSGLYDFRAIDLLSLLYITVIYLAVGCVWSLFKYKITAEYIAKEYIEENSRRDSNKLTKQNILDRIDNRIYKSTISYWILFFPFGILSFIFGDFIDYLVSKLGKVYKKIAEYVTNSAMSKINIEVSLPKEVSKYKDYLDEN